MVIQRVYFVEEFYALPVHSLNKSWKSRLMSSLPIPFTYRVHPHALTVIVQRRHCWPIHLSMCLYTTNER